MRAAYAARDENSTTRKLFADFKLLDDLSISIDVFFREILEQPSALPHQLQQPRTAMMILFVALEVRRQHVDVRGQYSNLDLGVPGICGALSKLLDELRLLFLGN